MDAMVRRIPDVLAYCKSFRNSVSARLGYCLACGVGLCSGLDLDARI